MSNTKTQQAEASYRQRLDNHPQDHHTWHDLAILYYQQSQINLALQAIERALALSPQCLMYLNNYGLMLRANQREHEALTVLRRALALAPQDVDIQYNLANTLLTLQHHDEALLYYQALYQTTPTTELAEAIVQCLLIQGNRAQTQGDFAQAEQAFRHAIALYPHEALLHYNLGNALRAQHQTQQAEQAYRMALHYQPDDADTHNNLGNVLRQQGQLLQAVEHYATAYRLNPKLHHALVHWIHQKQHLCDWTGLDEAIAQVRHWVQALSETQPPPKVQIPPFAFLAMSNTTRAEQQQCAKQWAQQRFAHLTPIAMRPQVKHARITLGYFSADFRLHPLAFLITDMIAQHNRQHFSVHAFSYGKTDNSPQEQALQLAFEHFHDISKLNDAQAVQAIQAAEVDILIDLTGYTQASRSQLCALRPAPILINWLGFPCTMGSMSTEHLKEKALYDYLLADHTLIPPEHAQDYSERLLYLPHSYQPQSQRPVGKSGTRAEHGLPDDAFVFACFNQSFKITAKVFNLWLDILRACPHSVLWLLECNMWANQNLRAHAQQAGIASERIIMAPRIPIADHLARHCHANLFLDTLPYNAHTTASDALYMGVPIVTQIGDTFAGRVCASLLNTMGLSELIVSTPQDYVALACQLAHQPTQLARIQHQLQQRDSPLFDTMRFVQALEAIYQDIYAQLFDSP